MPRPPRIKQVVSRMTQAALVAAAIIALPGAFTSRAHAQSLSGFDYNGQVYTSYQADEYLKTPQGPDGVAAIRKTGAAYGSVVVTQYIQTSTSNTIAPETATSPGYDSSKDPLSPTDSAVVAAIQNMHAQGLTVFLKPQVDSLDGVFRGYFAPTDVAAWFASYQTFMLHYAQLASDNNVGGLVIGTELTSLSSSAYRSYWLNIIAQLRASYPNLTLAYGANATYSGDEFTTVSFWDKVDIIGVDGYFPLTDHPDPTLSELVAAWTGNKDGFNIVAALKSLQSTYNKPLIFTELGYVSAKGTNQAPYASAAAGTPYDPTEQSNCYEAFFEVFSQQSSWMKGVFWWAWNVTPPGSMDTGYTPQNKPAADTTLVKWYGSATPGFTLAPSTSILTLRQGEQVALTISETDLGGFTGSVLLAAAGLPAGVTASLVPGSAPGTQVMTLSANSTAVAGPAAITITGTSGSLLTTATIALNVQSAAAQTIAFVPPGQQVVGTPLTLSATATSGLAVSFTSATPAVCTVTGSVASFLAPGTCTIDADQAGNSSYLPAPQVQQSFPVVAAPSFTLAVAAPTLSVTQDGSSTDTITVTPGSGFSGSVTLTVSGLPSGVTASFGTNPTTATSALTFTASATAATGTATITVNGTAGTFTGSTTIALTVSAPPSFTLTPASTSVSVSRGGSATEAISIASTGGFTGTVSLSAAITSSPQGAQNVPTLSFGATSPVSVTTAGGAATLTISTTAATSAALDYLVHGPAFWKIGGVAFAGLLLFGIPARRRRWRSLLSAAAFLLVLAGGMTGCGGDKSTPQPIGEPGTTSGTYTITVTATSGTTTASLPVTLNVQ